MRGGAPFLVPVIRGSAERRSAGTGSTPEELVSVPHEAGAECAVYAIHRSDDDDLKVAGVDNFAAAHAAMQTDGTLAALLHVAHRAYGWNLIACSEGVGVNGISPCMSITAVEPGDLLTIGDRMWFVASQWQPTPLAAPPELRDRPCPICGGSLGSAPVVQCPCGRWSHLENPAKPQDPASLNCFLQAGTCGECGRRASLEPQLIPALPTSLAAAEPSDD